MKNRDWPGVTLIVLVCTVLLQLPYVLGYLTAPPDTMYTGLLVNVEDANYITIIQRGSEGAWTHSLRFTSEPDAPAFLYVFYLAWGQLARVFRVDATTMWHTARVVMTLVCLMVTFGFVRTFITVRAPLYAAYLLAILGSGFDWFLFPWETVDPTSATPVDVKMADAHLFHSALTFPHYMGSIALLLVVFWCAARLLNENPTRPKFLVLIVLGAAANIGVTLVYPFFVVLSCGVLAMYLVLRMVRARKILWREGGIVAALVVPVLPLVWYYQMALSSLELLRVWSAQSQTLSPNPLHYLLTFAPYLILALMYLRRVGLGTNKEALLWAWVLVVALLVYAPLGAQRRFLQGVQIPLSILATCGLFQVVLPRVRAARWFQALVRRPNYSAGGLERLLVVAFLMMVCLSTAYQWLSAIAFATIAQPYPLFRPRSEVAAMDWLRANATPDDVVLSSYFSGSYLPYRSGTRAYLGHVYETIYLNEKMRNVDLYFDANTDDSRRRELVEKNGVRYVFYGRAERALGNFDPSNAPYLERVFENDAVTIYQIRE